MTESPQNVEIIQTADVMKIDDKPDLDNADTLAEQTKALLAGIEPAPVQPKSDVQKEKEEMLKKMAMLQKDINAHKMKKPGPYAFQQRPKNPYYTKTNPFKKVNRTWTPNQNKSPQKPQKEDLPPVLPIMNLSPKTPTGLSNLEAAFSASETKDETNNNSKKSGVQLNDEEAQLLASVQAQISGVETELKNQRVKINSDNSIITQEPPKPKPTPRQLEIQKEKEESLKKLAMLKREIKEQTFRLHQAKQAPKAPPVDINNELLKQQKELLTKQIQATQQLAAVQKGGTSGGILLPPPPQALPAPDLLNIKPPNLITDENIKAMEVSFENALMKKRKESDNDKNMQQRMSMDAEEAKRKKEKKEKKRLKKEMKKKKQEAILLLQQQMQNQKMHEMGGLKITVARSESSDELKKPVDFDQPLDNIIKKERKPSGKSSHALDVINNYLKGHRRTLVPEDNRISLKKMEPKMRALSPPRAPPKAPESTPKKANTSTAEVTFESVVELEESFGQDSSVPSIPIPRTQILKPNKAHHLVKPSRKQSKRKRPKEPQEETEVVKKTKTLLGKKSKEAEEKILQLNSADSLDHLDKELENIIESENTRKASRDSLELGADAGTINREALEEKDEKVEKTATNAALDVHANSDQENDDILDELDLYLAS